MFDLNNLIENKPLIIAATSWLVAGILKVFVELRINRKLSISRIVGAG